MEVMKQLRQRAIRDLVEQRPIRTQQELAAALRERGFRTTQATISRDVAELGLVKAGRGGTHAYAIPPRLREADTSGEDRIRTLLRDMPVEIRDAGTMLVLQTLPGLRASAGGGPGPRAVAGGRRAPSRATTRCSSRSRTAARWGGCDAGWSSSASSGFAAQRRRETAQPGSRRGTSAGSSVPWPGTSAFAAPHAAAIARARSSG